MRESLLKLDGVEEYLDPEFMRTVQQELAHARTRALEVLNEKTLDGICLPEHAPDWINKIGTELLKPKKAENGGRRPGRSTCIGCGCAFDQKTPGCKICVNRHSHRKNAKLRNYFNSPMNLPKFHDPRWKIPVDDSERIQSALKTTVVSAKRDAFVWRVNRLQTGP